MRKRGFEPLFYVVMSVAVFCVDVEGQTVSVLYESGCELNFSCGSPWPQFVPINVNNC